jgi:hypothetical protein
MTLRVKQALQAGNPAVSARTAICGRRVAFCSTLRNSAVSCVVFATTFAMAPLARAVDVEAVRIDGTIVAGEWGRVVDGSRLELLTAEGSRTLMFDDLSVVDFENDELSPTGDVRVFLADGGRIRGDLVIAREKDAIVVQAP